ncbi:MAG: GGDEF domain-containing protein [Burkholderiales bacterium]
MLKSRLAKLWNQSWSMVLTEIGPQEIGGLFRAVEHSPQLTVRRAGLIVSRVRLAAGLLAVLTPMWILADIWIFSPEIWMALLPMRLITAFAFASILIAIERMHTLRDAYVSLAYLMLVPAAFFLFVHFHLSGLHVGNQMTGYWAGYAYLPFIMIAVLAIFPLTIFEAAWFAMPMVIAQSIAMFPSGAEHDGIAFVTSTGALLLVVGVSILAGLSQLAFIMVMIREGIHDSLTGCYSRRCGEELVDLQFTWSVRTKIRLSIALVGVDDFQEINKQFGYATGEAILKSVTEKLHDSMRSGDTITRWSGEIRSLWSGDQYLLTFPNATAEQACMALRRILAGGLGVRPDGAAITASIGVAERISDAAQDWWNLVDLTSIRMQSAIRIGGNRTVDR